MNRLLADLLYDGVLDQQYLSLKELEESSPNFLSELVTNYFDDAENYIRKLRQHVMTHRNFSDNKKTEVCLYGLKGCSTYIGVKRVLNVLLAFEDASKQKNQDRCLRALEVVEHEYFYLKNKLQELLQVEQQRVIIDLPYGSQMDTTTDLQMDVKPQMDLSSSFTQMDSNRMHFTSMLQLGQSPNLDLTGGHTGSSADSDDAHHDS